MAKELDVVIVGGGLAGLSAAKTLCANGNFEVALLEADKIVGGRVKTDYLPDGTPIAIGAASFHGKEGNSLLAYAKSDGIADSVEMEIQNDSVLHTYSGGRTVPDGLVENVEEKVWQIMDGIEFCLNSTNFVRMQEDKIECSDADTTSLDMHDFIYSKMAPICKENNNASHDLITILEGVLSYEGITEGCKSLHGLDVASFGEWPYLDESVDLIFKDNPYLSIVSSLASKIPTGIIEVEKEVCIIEWTEKWIENRRPPKVIVKCTDGTIYRANHVIYTCSLGVLKHACSLGLFHPSLPIEKVTAVEKIGISLVNKVILQFDAPLLLGHEYDQFRLYWSENDKTNSIVSSSPWILGFQFIRVVPSVSGRFLYNTFFVGEDADSIEKLPEDEVGHIIVLALNFFLAQPIPKLMAIKVTNWSKPFTRGSYSYNPQGTNLDEREKLARPVGKQNSLQILFAGEATSIDQYGCAHSAFDTGVREAQRLIDYYAKSAQQHL